MEQSTKFNQKKEKSQCPMISLNVIFLRGKLLLVLAPY